MLKEHSIKELFTKEMTVHLFYLVTLIRNGEEMKLTVNLQQDILLWIMDVRMVFWSSRKQPTVALSSTEAVWRFRKLVG